MDANSSPEFTSTKTPSHEVQAPKNSACNFYLMVCFSTLRGSGGVRLMSANTLASSTILANSNRSLLTHSEHRHLSNLIPKPSFQH